MFDDELLSYMANIEANNEAYRILRQILNYGKY